MAQCSYTFAIEAAIHKKLKRIKFCILLDTYTEESAKKGLAEGKLMVEKMLETMSVADAKFARESFKKSNKLALSKFRHLSRAKFIMGDYTDHLFRLTEEIRGLTVEIREHDCGPAQHPENLPEGARRN